MSLSQARRQEFASDFVSLHNNIKRKFAAVGVGYINIACAAQSWIPPVNTLHKWWKYHKWRWGDAISNLKFVKQVINTAFLWSERINNNPNDDHSLYARFLSVIFLIDEQPKPCQGLPALHTYHTVVSGMSRAFKQWESSRMSSVLQYTDCELRQVQFALVHCINAFNLLDSNLFNCVLNNYYQSVNIRVNLNCTKQLHQSVNIRVNFNCQSTFFSISWTGQ